MLLERDPLKFASPAYCAIIMCVPVARVDVVKVADPLFNGIAPEIGVVPSKNTTDPVAFAGVTVAMNVPGAPSLRPSISSA